MKVSLVFFMMGLGACFANDVYSQKTFFTLEYQNRTIKDVFSEIEKKSEYIFFYLDNSLDLNRKVSVKAKKQRVEAILDQVFDGTDNRYYISDRQIIISKEEAAPQPAVAPVSEQQQGKRITGTVTDTKGEPLIGASVVIKGTTNGIITDLDGKFSLDVSPGATLVVSYIGYYTQEIPIGIQTSLNITLIEDTKMLEEVIVVGYGTQKKLNLTGAISAIKSDEIQNTVATSVVQKLQGKVSGLNIRQNTGEPGEFNSSVNIRGFGTPLYVVDGIVIPAWDFLKINGEDIESISVLKDAAAAVYGMNASNGVIIVTTKRGTIGKTKFNFSTNAGWSTPTDMPKMANAYEYMTLRNEAATNFGYEPFLSREDLEKWRIGAPGYENTDWMDATFHKYTPRQEYSLSAQGGTEKVSYYFNLNGILDNGNYKTDDLFYRKLSFRSNITANLTNHLKAVFNISGYFDKREYPPYGIFGVMRGTEASHPIHSVYANNNPLYLNRVQDGETLSPVATSSSDLTGYGRMTNDVYKTSLELRYEVPFVKGLEIKGLGAYDKSFAQFKGLNKEYALYDYDAANDTYIPTMFNSPTSIRNNYDNYYYLLLRAQADYKTSIAESHNIAATLVYEQKESFNRNANILKYYDFYTNDQIDQASNANAQSGGNEATTRGISYIGRVNYDYMGKYLIELAGRYDGSYRYYPDRRWGFFPVVSGGWRISEERFLKNISLLSNLKIRASYGKIGEDAGNPFQYIPGFAAGGGWAEFTDGTATNGLRTPAIVNEKLTWMTNTITNIGVDIGLFDNKLSLTFDVFKKDRDGLLAYRNVSLPNTFGGTFPEENLNKDQVKGLEFSFVHQNNVGDINYNISGNVSFSQTRAVYVERAPFTDSWDYYQNQAIGRNSGFIWGYNVIGQYKSMEEINNAPVVNGVQGNQYVLPGDYIFEDVNGDGVIDADDTRPEFLDNNPRMNYGLTLSANWKGIDFSMLFQGAALFSMQLQNLYTMMFSQGANIPAYYMDRWHRADPYDANSEWIPGKYPAMRTANYNLLYAQSSAWRKDCSYVRFKNLELGYTFKQNLIKQTGLDNLRLFVNMTNVFTWCNDFIKPLDPEIPNSYGWVYPLQKTYSVGLSLNF
jgi:TonB-linked SusC/RagA family outer membrane protein